MSLNLSLLSPTMRLERQEDPVIEALGYYVHAEYVEKFWLPIVGPSSFVLLRRLVLLVLEGVDEVDIEDLGRQLGGLGPKLLTSALDRLDRNYLVKLSSYQGGVLCRLATSVPPLNRRQVERLPETLRREHEQIMEARA